MASFKNRITLKIGPDIHLSLNVEVGLMGLGTTLNRLKLSLGIKTKRTKSTTHLSGEDEVVADIVAPEAHNVDITIGDECVARDGVAKGNDPQNTVEYAHTRPATLTNGTEYQASAPETEQDLRRDQLGATSTRETTYLGHPFLYPSGSLIGAEFIERGKEWDPVLRTIVPALLPDEDPMICEIGSNIGASLLQILVMKPRARVIAFEPSVRFRPFLERNLELAGFNHVEVCPMLVGRHSSSSIWLYNNASTASAVSANYDGHKFCGKQISEMTTLDEVFRDRERVDFIKTDTDGFDFEVLRGAETTLKRDRPILFLELATYLLTAPVNDLTWLQSLGYQQLTCLSPQGELIGATEDPEQAVDWANKNGYCDVLMCSEDSMAEVRLERLLLY